MLTSNKKRKKQKKLQQKLQKSAAEVNKQAGRDSSEGEGQPLSLSPRAARESIITRFHMPVNATKFHL